MKNFLSRLFLYLKRLVFFSGAFSLLLLLLSFTTWPFYAYHWLGASLSEMKEKPEYIILLGGGGMPSPSNLMRAYFVAAASENFPESEIILSIPGDLEDEKSTPRLVASELKRRGVDRDRIFHEAKGTNTRSQAVNLSLFYGGSLVDQPVLLVTSPEHMRRSVLCFRKAGFTKINALPAFEHALESDLSFDDRKLGGNRLPVPRIGKNKTLRYQFWNHLKYEILIAREMAALGYYRLRGWI
jgi:uncharacterized SAM-binding protein YcdF (DUF218 family)